MKQSKKPLGRFWEDTALALRNSRRLPLRIRIIRIFHGPPILLANIGTRGALLPRAHGKRTGCRLDEGALQHKSRNEKDECGKENQEKRQTLRSGSVSHLRALRAHASAVFRLTLAAIQNAAMKMRMCGRLTRKIRLQRDLIQMGDEINDYVD